MTEAADSRETGDRASPWDDALLALSLFAVDPAGLAGVRLRSPPGPARTAWLDLLRLALPPAAPVRRVPANIGDPALLGGLDLAATLRAGRPVHAAGLLAACDGGVAVLAMAERMPAATAARLCAVLDGGTIDHGTDRSPCRLGVVALDEGIEADESTAAALLDRLAFDLDLSAVSHRALGGDLPEAGLLAAARRGVARVALSDQVIGALCGAGLALGIGSPRGVLLAARAARAAAALEGREEATMEDAALAARLVLAPRATRLPAEPADTSEPQPADDPPQDRPAEDKPASDAGAEQTQGRAADADILLAAARAAIPGGLLARLQSPDLRAGRQGEQGSGARQKGARRGRPAGTRAGSPDAANRLDLIETLRAAAPWQRLRATSADPAGVRRILIRREDFRVTRSIQQARSLSIFVVDASGSAAVARLAEAKGAVELLLAECYLRRDQVALVAFRGTGAQLLLPPTRSLVRAKRCLATLPGGGGTPMAAGIDAGFLLAESARRGGLTPTLILLTDGRANVTRAGTGGRALAQAEASEAARRVRAARLAALLLDTSPRPAPQAASLAADLGAVYVALPYADASALSGAVRAASARA